MRVKHCMTIHKNETKLAPCARLNRPVLNMRKCILVHATGAPELEIFSESCDPQSERQPSLRWRKVCHNCSFRLTGVSKYEYFNWGFEI